MVLWCLTPLSTIFQLYRGGQFYWWRKPDYPVKTTELSQVTDNLSHSVVSSTPRLSGIRTHNVSSHKYNYYTITPMTAPQNVFIFKHRQYLEKRFCHFTKKSYHYNSIKQCYRLVYIQLICRGNDVIDIILIPSIWVTSSDSLVNSSSTVIYYLISSITFLHINSLFESMKQIEFKMMEDFFIEVKVIDYLVCVSLSL